MTADVKKTVYKGVDLHCQTNNTEHHTSEISVDRLIVRRGQPFTLTLKLTQCFNPDLYPLNIVAMTGKHPSDVRGTMSFFSVPDRVQGSPSAKAVWKIALHKSSTPLTGLLNLTITPPADTPIGEYLMYVTHRDEKMLLATPVVLFNPWCPDDWVFLSDGEQRQEYVMNEQGIIYQGSGSYISPMNWDYGQFEDNMVDICLKMLDMNNKHLNDPADDVSARCNPIYVSRVVSAMVNCNDDRGVLLGRWEGSFCDGVPPFQWNGSHAILKQWINTDCSPVKYGQCWVFAGVMCSVMRLLGIPCRVVTNFESAHDNNSNLIIDVYHADYGVREKESPDSIWNFHVWVEGWMRRPDLAKDGKYDGWQVLDPTPQEKSDGVYCCGPASVTGILNGDTDLKYDVPFVFAEVNADCIDWLIKADGSKVNILSDTKRVGQNISTKSVGSNKRMDITNSYKYREGSEKERSVFKYAVTRLSPNVKPVESGPIKVNDEITPDCITPLPQVSIRFEEVSKPMNGRDVSLKLVLGTVGNAARPLSINISVQAMRHNGSPAVTIQTEVKKETLQPGRDLSIPILVPFLAYNKHMVKCESMKVSVMVTDKQKPNNIYLAAQDIVLLNPPISITVSRKPLSLCLSIYHLSSDFVQVSVTLVKSCYYSLDVGPSLNFHVWVEGWMRRPDLAKDGKYDGWQVLDPTPQEKSDGVYCCGPASVTGILNGDTDLKYDVPFVFAEVNADCIDWLIKADGSKVNILSDTKRVGQNISTKSVGSNKRMDITNSYKYREGSEKERSVFKYAVTRLSPNVKPVESGPIKVNDEITPDCITPLPQVSIRFEEVSKPMNGRDVSLKLVLGTVGNAARPLSINISVQAMRHNGSPAVTIQTEVKKETLQPGRDLSIPILVPFLAYNKHMVKCESMKVSVMVTDKQKPNNIYLAAQDIVLLNPPISITVSSPTRLNCEASGEVVFMNPVDETLKDCTLTLTGSGLLKEEIVKTFPDLKPNNRIHVKFFFVPNKIGDKTLVANFDCSTFRHIKGSCSVNVRL
ncbi:protein-glutamine gamma-glutamyltransferase 5 [Micropterus dolomieu]|uniref:protein-glutamine gamma-glutamyltransferase 5 n=1 Tax=Micropterus dolomieu TaxID=147949 RepID=UPI001E8E2F25|nr:protein-glutamine gamma-glutamyltransferase 5 [Micropterus dolomieu]